MSTGEKLLKLLAHFVFQRFYGTVTIRFEGGKVTHVESETRRTWQYKELPEDRDKGCLIGQDVALHLREG